ncbi:BAH and coiled-coil domain-containing protein 1-like isoform X2 [Stegodyphus dumicola]|uniref:BAH and coiled-coil domain-containing protein 1-like isoform X2 n=1 Tax=Stegodyphus dumicola TaxID=202533 RepID=UPI0015AFA95B|nr:BAH and coiled-coil domain-containing protein 1-like isoform X2 [Stegodyphus dumicola]
MDNNCNITACDTAKSEDKVEDVSGQVPSVPLATGQTYAFTTFPTQCDPSSFSYVLQSSTVMHLAHTQTTASIQTESGRRSQGTSPLHCATPSPPPNTCSVQVSVTEDEESDNESDDVACCETTQVQTSCHSQSVTTAIQVDMDSQTNSEEDEEEERKIEIDKTEENKVEMSDSANQTESVPSESPKSDVELEDVVLPQDEQVGKEISENLPSTAVFESAINSDIETPIGPNISIKEDIVHSEAGLEIVTSETELAPSLPVESKPVMDFIDHHGLNLLVDSIEEFASREQEAHHKQEDGKQTVMAPASISSDVAKEVVNNEQIVKAETKESDCSLSVKSYTPSYKTIDTSCTDGLGLLCALAEQRFFEEAMNVDENKAKQLQNNRDCYSFEEEMDNNSHSNVSSVKEHLQQPNSNDSSLHSSGSSSPDHGEATELEMRLRLAELQKKYRQKQRELELLKNKKEKENSDDDLTYLAKPSKTRKTISPVRNASASHVKYSSGFNEDNIYSQNSVSKPWQKKQSKSPEEALMNENLTCSLNVVKQCNAENDKCLKEDQVEITDKEEKVPSVRTSPEISTSLCGDSNTSIPSSDLSNESFCKKSACAIKKFKSENSLDSNSSMSKDDGSSQDQDYDKNDKSKTPFFDEQAWFVRRSERIFLSDARSTAVQQQQSAVTDKNKRSGSNASQKISVDVNHKEKKEHSIKSTNVHKSQDDSEGKKGKCRGLKKSKSNLPKKRSLSESCDSGSSCDEEVSSSDSEHSDGASSTSENLPLSIFVEQSSSKTPMPERQKRLSTDSECSDFSSGQSEDIPLSVLIGQKSIKYPELKSCILTPDELQENARLLVLDEGLFYAGYITKSEDPDMYGILIDGERAARPHMFSKEEILNAAVLEVKPTHKQQLPEGSRICAFWSQQYRCLYPGTITKASSPLPDPSMLYVEFDDGDSGRIALNDIRMLPPDFPIVSMEPNPFMILGKRRARAQSQNGSTVNDAKNGSEATNQKNDKEKSEHKKHKNVVKASKKSHIEGKNSKEMSKSKSKSPSTSNRSRSSSKSSCSSHSEVKNQSIAGKKETSEESKKKTDMKSKHCLKQQNFESKTDDMCASVSKPKKHKKHKEDHHKHHHHHHHKHHHHKKHKAEKQERHSVDAVISSSTLPSSEDSSNCLSSPADQNTFILENSKSELTVKIKKSPSPHTAQEEAAAALVVSSAAAVTSKTRALSPSGCSSADDDASLEPAKKKVKKVKQQITQSKPAKRKDRMPSVEKSKIAAFLPVRQLWRWSGKSFRRPGAKGKAKKEFYRAIQRGKETIRVGDCAVFLSTGRPHLPYIGRIETMWESWGGKMDVKVKWFYHPEETKSGKKLSQIKGALFQSPHFDENDVQTISHKCEVLSWEEYQQKRHPENNYGSLFDNNDTYFLAGTYDPIMGTLILEPGVPAIPSTTSSDL